MMEPKAVPYVSLGTAVSVVDLRRYHERWLTLGNRQLFRMGRLSASWHPGGRGIGIKRDYLELPGLVCAWVGPLAVWWSGA